jgi:rare lipoprotein A
MRRHSPTALVVTLLVGCSGTPTPDPGTVSDETITYAESIELDPDELIGEATWYGERHHGRTTASGEPFDMYAMTAAHKTLPFGTVVRVIRDDTRQSVVVTINDRGPYGPGRVIDLSMAAAEEIDLIRPGHIPVVVEILSLP